MVAGLCGLIKARLVVLPENDTHGSAKYYYKNEQVVYVVKSYIELADINLTLGK
jgi:hypothetical protein